MEWQESSIVADYRARTPGSARLFDRARSLFPGGVNHDSRLLLPYPLSIDRARGSRKWDVDGHELVDYTGGHGALLLGHNPPAVVEAVRAQLSKGTHYGSNHELEARWGELVTEMVPSAERVRFVSSGTESTHLALRLARAFTGRDKVLRLKGHFHGWQDHTAFGYSSHFDGSPTPGVLAEVASSVILVPPDLDAVRKILEETEVAAVMLEPTGASWGQVPVGREFLAGLRELTAAHEVVLVFDEVICGFRVSPGGAQQALGITPDLTTLGKIVAGGLPGAAVTGRKEILDLLDPEASRAAGREKVPHQGTFNANPLSAAAGIATLQIVRDTDACQVANEYGARLRQRLEQVAQEMAVPWVVYGSYSGFHIFANSRGLAVGAADLEAGRVGPEELKGDQDRSLLTLMRLGFINHGVDIMPWPGGPTSSVHDDADLEQTVDAFRSTLEILVGEGFVPVLSERRG